MYIDLVLSFTNKADLIAAIKNNEHVSALDHETGEDLPDGTNVYIRIMGYKNYRNWTAKITIKDGRITKVE